MLGQVQRQKNIHIYKKIQSFTHARNGEIRVKSRREGQKEKKKIQHSEPKSPTKPEMSVNQILTYRSIHQIMLSISKFSMFSQ